MMQYQLKRPEDLKAGDRFLYGGQLRTITFIRHAIGNGCWIAALQDYTSANIVGARFVVAREDADPVRDPIWLGLDGTPYVQR